MKITLGGIRGTGPVTGNAFVKYGGDTTSLLVEGSHGARVVLDMGTGIRLVDHRLRRIANINPLLILQTHYHLDHVMGIPSFSVLDDPGWTLQFVGPRLEGFTVAEVMHRLLDMPFWPLQVTAMRATIKFADLGSAGFEGPLQTGCLQVRWCAVHHPGGCVAYRIEEPATGAAIVSATDIEWAESSADEKASFLRLCREPQPAQLLLFDGQFTPDNCVKYRGWGHSTWLEAVKVAEEAGIHRLLVIHHAPSRDDEALRSTEEQLSTMMPSAHLAVQGQTLEVPFRPGHEKKSE